MKRSWAVAAGLTLALGSSAVRAQEVDQLAERVKVLERKLELQDEANKTAAQSAPAVRASARGFQIQSADGAHVVKLRGVLHFDGRYFGDDITPETADTWILRRVRPTLEGTLHKIYDFRITPDFAGGRASLLDAFVAARFNPAFVVTAGKFKVPVGLERLVSATDLRFIERAYPTGLLPNRDLGVQIGGDIAGGALNYSVGYFNGVTDGGSSDGGTPADAETDTKGDIAARVFVQPFVNSDVFALRGVGFGVAGTYVDVAGTPATPNLATYRTAGQQSLFQFRSATAGVTPNNATYADGVRWRVTPQAHYYNGRFGLLAEYARVSQDVSRQVSASGTRSETLDTSAWHIQAVWFITGEEQAFKGYKVGSTFAPGRPGSGAFEIVARAHGIRFDDKAFEGGANSFANPIAKAGKASGAIQARKATSFGVGLNWYLNEAFKWQIDYEITRFDGGGAVIGADAPDERALFTRFAAGF